MQFSLFRLRTENRRFRLHSVLSLQAYLAASKESVEKHGQGKPPKLITMWDQVWVVVQSDLLAAGIVDTAGITFKEGN